MLETLSTDYFRRFRTEAEIVERKKRRLEKEKENGGGDAKNGSRVNNGPKEKKKFGESSGEVGKGWKVRMVANLRIDD